MDLQIGLAIVDGLHGGKETKRRMDGWIHQESKAMRRLRTVGAQALVALAARLAPERPADAPLGKARHEQPATT